MALGFDGEKSKALGQLRGVYIHYKGSTTRTDFHIFAGAKRVLLSAQASEELRIVRFTEDKSVNGQAGRGIRPCEGEITSIAEVLTRWPKTTTCGVLSSRPRPRTSTGRMRPSLPTD